MRVGDLTSRLDGLRDTPNLFVAIHLRGVFDRIRYRVACKGQATFDLDQVAGTLVGF